MKERIFKLVQHAAGRLRRSLDGNTRLFIFFLEPFSREVQICWPLNNVPETTAATASLIQNCFKRQRSMLVHDSQVDPLIGSVKGADFRSALCVPLFDKANNMMGVIYLDSPVVGKLDKEERLEVERLSRDLSSKIPPWTPAEIAPPKPAEQSRVIDPRMLVALFALICFFAMSWLLAPNTPGEKRAASGLATPSEAVEKKAVDTVRSFVQMITLRQYPQAWNLLDPTLQAELPRDKFEELIQTWMSDADNRWDLQRREFREGTSASEPAVVHLDPGEELPDAASWSVHLRRVEGKWLIERWQGGGPLDSSNNGRSAP